MNLEIYEKSVTIAKELGFVLSDSGISESTQLPPVEEWSNDKKLSGFLDLHSQINVNVKDENIKSSMLAALEAGIKRCRSASIGSLRGSLLERAVEALAHELGCTVERNVRMNDIADESIDCVITLKSGEKLYCMCQVDLWGGGQQINRAYKYLTNDKITSVVYNRYDLKKHRPGSKSDRTQQLLLQSHTSKKLMWLSDLDLYIRENNEKLSRL